MASNPPTLNGRANSGYLKDRLERQTQNEKASRQLAQPGHNLRASRRSEVCRRVSSRRTRRRGRSPRPSHCFAADCQVQRRHRKSCQGRSTLVAVTKAIGLKLTVEAAWQSVLGCSFSSFLGTKELDRNSGGVVAAPNSHVASTRGKQFHGAYLVGLIGLRLPFAHIPPFGQATRRTASASY